MVPRVAGRALLSIAIVAGLVHRTETAPPIAQDVRVPGGTAAMAEVLHIAPAPEPARFVAEVTRLLYDVPLVKTVSADFLVKRLTAHLASTRQSDTTAADVVPIPLSVATWAQVLRRPLTVDTVFAAIITDRQATLLCHALAALDDETLQFLTDHPSVIRRLYEHDAAAFGAFGASLRIHAGEVQPRGGAKAVASWEIALGQRVNRPEAFVRELYSREEGRIAYLYDTLAQLDPSKLAFALGQWMPETTRVERFKALVVAAGASYREWRIQVLPFSRPPHDLTVLLDRIRVAADGTPRLSSRAVWRRIFEARDAREEPDAAPPPGPDSIDAAWLVESIVHREVQARADRAEQFAFGQRVFGSRADAAVDHDVVAAVRALPRFRMLMLTLERMGITTPAVYGAAALQAQRLTALPPNRAFTALAQFQGAMALVARMARARTLDSSRIEPVVSSLIGVPITDDGRYAGGLVRWVADSLRRALPPADTLEETLVPAMAGRSSNAVQQDGEDAAPLNRIRWEGHEYRLDVAGAELRRLRRVREKQDGPSPDAADAVERVARALARENLTIDDVRSATQALTSVASTLEPRRRKPDVETLPPGVDPPKNARELLERAAKELSTIEGARDMGRAGRIAPGLADVADALLADALLSIAYAADLGDADGAALLAGNVARRHDFGFGLKDSETRARAPWTTPRQEVAPGAPWHVSGSLLGLDVGLAPLALRRITADRVVDAPTLTSNERETFAISVALMNPIALRDEDRDAIVAAVGRGRSRLAAMTADNAGALADAVEMDGWRRRALHWTLAHDPARAASLVTLTETLALGAPARSLDPWGMSAFVTEGCLCTRLASPGHWLLWTGRPQLGQVASGVADLNLHVALTLHELRLPASLARYVLESAVQDFIDEVRPTDPNDWLTIARAASRVSRERVEDYVAAAAADGPLLPDSSGPTFETDTAASLALRLDRRRPALPRP